MFESLHLLYASLKRETSKIKAASIKTSEEVWELPINDDYMDMVKSKVADIKNLGMGRAAGTITAAAFLANSVGNVSYRRRIIRLQLVQKLGIRSLSKFLRFFKWFFDAF